jgi:exo-beta-1,3-glucanase (GH17 family)
VKDRVATVSPGKPVWVTETGWPVSGANFGASVSSKANAQAYWSAVGCSVVRQYNTFWYTLQDYASSPSFGVLDANGKALYNLKC